MFSLLHTIVFFKNSYKPLFSNAIRHGSACILTFLLYFIFDLFIYIFFSSSKAPVVIMLPAHAAGYLTQALNHLSLHRHSLWHHAGSISSPSLTARQLTNLSIHPTPLLPSPLILMRLVKQVTERKQGN